LTAIFSQPVKGQGICTCLGVFSTWYGRCTCLSRIQSGWRALG